MLLRAQPNPSEEDWQTLQGELLRAIELQPQFVEATEMLAAANLQRNVDLGRTADLLTQALAIAPGRDYLALQLAYVVSRTDQRASAKPMIQRLLAKSTLEPRVRQDAENLLSFLDRTDAAEAANRAVLEEMRRRQEAAIARLERAPAFEREEREDPAGDARPDLVRTRPEPEPGNGIVTPPPPVEPALPPGTARIRGVLTQLDCTSGLTLVLQSGGKTVRLRSSAPNAVKFTTYNPAVATQIACGPTPGKGVPASIVYAVRPSGDSLGDPLTVDFVEE
jgi:hypothetical protein